MVWCREYGEKLVFVDLRDYIGVFLLVKDLYGWLVVVGFVLLEFWVFLVGWFDVDIEGLLLLINDGCIMYWIMYLSFGVEKEYFVEVEGVLMDVMLVWFCYGVELDDGVIVLVRVWWV